MQLLGLLERMGMGKLSGRDRTCPLYILELALSSPHGIGQLPNKKAKMYSSTQWFCESFQSECNSKIPSSFSLFVM